MYLRGSPKSLHIPRTAWQVSGLHLQSLHNCWCVWSLLCCTPNVKFAQQVIVNAYRVVATLGLSQEKTGSCRSCKREAALLMKHKKKCHSIDKLYQVNKWCTTCGHGRCVVMTRQTWYTLLRGMASIADARTWHGRRVHMIRVCIRKRKTCVRLLHRIHVRSWYTRSTAFVMHMHCGVLISLCYGTATTNYALHVHSILPEGHLVRVLA